MLDRQARDRAALSDSDSESASEQLEDAADIGSTPASSLQVLPMDADLLEVWKWQMARHPAWQHRIVTPRSLRGAGKGTNTLGAWLAGMFENNFKLLLSY